ncbi:MAG: alkaline phosphatase family protein [Candidatus Binataceae bacterium]
MKSHPLVRAMAGAALIIAFGCAVAAGAQSTPAHTPGRIFVLMVWDGLRPDLVTKGDTPELYALEGEGVQFAHQHSVYPTLTMVNAAVLATGAAPAGTGIYGDSMYLAPLLAWTRLSAPTGLAYAVTTPIELEHTNILAELNAPHALDGRLLGLETLAQRVTRTGGYIAIIGKAGPTFLFDDGVGAGTPGGAEASAQPLRKYLFVSDDMVEPPSVKLPARAPMKSTHPASVGDRDVWFTDLVISKALPAAKATSLSGAPAFIVFWQHNPDLVQHIAGLGTQPALDALKDCDRNLALIRAAIAAYGIAGRTDLMVVSDHGFATIRAPVHLASLLVAAGLKQSPESDDIVVAPNGGSDLIYLARTRFKNPHERRAILERIVDFAAAQPWCGPIFSRNSAPAASGAAGDYIGWIPGTFSQKAFGLYDPARSPDLVLSFRAFPNESNHGLTGPGNPGLAITSAGVNKLAPNNSMPLVRAMEGVIYSDTGNGGHFTTGMGMHGAAGARELHNFCAAAGPDFRRHFRDLDPTGNVDVAPTIGAILHESPAAGASGRVMDEALADGSRTRARSPQPLTMTAHLALPETEITTTLQLTRYAGHDYLDGSSVAHTPIHASGAASAGAP